MAERKRDKGSFDFSKHDARVWQDLGLFVDEASRGFYWHCAKCGARTASGLFYDTFEKAKAAAANHNGGAYNDEEV